MKIFFSLLGWLLPIQKNFELQFNEILIAIYDG